MEFHTWFLFASVCFISSLTPGPAVLLALSNGLLYNVKATVFSSLGNVSGLFCLSCFYMVGLGAVLKTSLTLFIALKIIGACYLIYLGIKHFRSKASFLDTSNLHLAKQKSALALFRSGFLVCITNPKAFIFFTALFPPFLNHTSPLMPQFILMTFTFMFFSFSILVSYACFAKYFKPILANTKKMLLFHKVVGSLFVALGIGILQIKNVE